jgi:hypothetical protein
MDRQTILPALTVALLAAAGCDDALGPAVPRDAASLEAGPAGAADAGEDGDAGPAPWSIALDPRAIGHGDLSGVVVAAFSQTSTNARDPQVLDLAPDIVPRAWSQWDIWGLTPADYTFDYPAACRAQGTTFVGGLTASVIFQDEMTAEEFADEVGRDATGNPVAHDEIVAGAYRGALASPGFRKRLVDIAKLQIDGGVDGLFFDEVNSSYIGANYSGNEGFDDHDVADFGRFLCQKYRAEPSGLAAFDLTPDDRLDCSGADPGASFDYRGYLAHHGAQTSPLGAANPIQSAWGTTIQNRPDPAQPTFVETYPALVYWQEIVVAVRSYARDRYNKEILVTANGIFPFVDFQSVGLYDWNHDGTGPRGFDYVPVQGTHLDGTVSYMSVLQGLQDRSQRIVTAAGGQPVPLLLFLDWPTDSMNRYYALPLSERQDYLRIVLGEAYSFGMWFALPLATTTDSNTATALGMMGFLHQMRDFYHARGSLVRGGSPSSSVVRVSASGVASRLVDLTDGRTVLHLINHNYAAGFLPQTSVVVTIPRSRAPTSVMLASPDLGADQPVDFSYANGEVSLTISSLVSTMLVVVD